ncbi:MAG: hypothetical protein ACKV2U_06930 [Bryobacteraceae bacterium]
MHRRRFLRAATAVTTPLAAGNYAVAADKPRPSILWISCEDSSPYAFSCYGDPLAWTPNIDRDKTTYPSRVANRVLNVLRGREKEVS